jgi:hypothetical protein
MRIFFKNKTFSLGSNSGWTWKNYTFLYVTYYIDKKSYIKLKLGSIWVWSLVINTNEYLTWKLNLLVNISIKNQIAYLKTLPLFKKLYLHDSNFKSGSSKKLIQMFGSCVDSHKKRYELGSKSQKLDLEPLILTLKIQYFQNIGTYNIGR